MIIVTGSVTARADTEAAVAELSLAHVRRSRLEPGCITHTVSRDLENEHRFVFVEEWATRADLDRHFTVPESRQFVTDVTNLAIEAPTITIHVTTEH